MKRVFFKSFSVLLAFVFLATQTQALQAGTNDKLIQSIDESALVLDEDALNEAMQELDDLDEFLVENAGVTYGDLLSTGSDLIHNVDHAAAPLGMDGSEEPPLGIPSFLWGCILGVIGILLVYVLTDGDKAEVKKSLWGFLVAVGVYVIIYVAAWGTIFAVY